MAIPIHRVSLLLAIALLPSFAGAQVTDLDLRLPWDIVSETMAFDGKTSTVIYTGLRFSQGATSIEADEGRATNLEQQDSSWQFSGNVVIVVNNGSIKCDSATLQFDGNILNTATVTGTPATFELQREDSGDVTSAEAGRLMYDVKNGVIEFSERATITESGNQISSNYFVYDINERRINADSAGDSEARVRITYTPTNGNGNSSLPDTDANADAVNPEDEDQNQ